MTPDHCDVGYIDEAYSVCLEESDNAACMDEADLLYDVMTRVHAPVTRTRLQCEAKCVREYILGDFEKK